MDDFSGSRKPVRIFYIEINGNLIFDLRIFTLRTVFIERITFVNRGMGVITTYICLYVGIYYVCIYVSYTVKNNAIYVLFFEWKYVFISFIIELQCGHQIIARW
jgi:hypothetical protein